ncbi:MAG TPA: hypothetical protein VKV77_14065 [Methylovirgula sp.]|nr:hypothetical protein [Methylovirgula sp.]
MSRAILVLLAGVAFCAAALAQTSGSATPQDNDANSTDAMKDGLQDPRIEGAEPGKSWGMWDIGRPHPLQGKGAFEDHDPIGVAAGKLIPTDCSFNWTDPDTHQVFCFGSQASLVYFLSAPKTNESRAEKRWRMLKGLPTG